MAKRKPPTPAAKPPVRTPAEALDRLERVERGRLAQSAQQKLAAGQTPTRPEARALRAAHDEAVERYGSERVANYPKGQFCQALGRAPKVVIDVMRRHGLPSYFSHPQTVDLIAAVRDLFNLAVENSDIIVRRQRARALQATGDEDADYDFWDTKRVRALALMKEHELERTVERWAPVEAFAAVIHHAFEVELRAMMEDYEQKPTVKGEEVANRIRAMLGRLELEIDEHFGSNQDDAGS